MRRACLDMVHELAQRDERVVFVGSDLGPGVLDSMRTEMPERFFMEGIAEQNLIGLAAGLALDGFIPYVNTIATFLTRRCYEQIALDACLHNLPLRLIGNGGGLVYAPLGPTHLAVEDFAIMRALPNMTVLAPCDADEMRRLVPQTLELEGPSYIRLGKGGDKVVSHDSRGFTIGRAIEMRGPARITILSTGVMTQRALAVADRLEEHHVPCGVLHFHTVKPLDVDAIIHAAQSSEVLVTLEEHTRTGGFGSAVGETLLDADLPCLPRILRLGLPDEFAHEYGRQDELLDRMGLGIDALVRQIGTAAGAL